MFHSLVFEKCLELLNYSQWHFQGNLVMVMCLFRAGNNGLKFILSVKSVCSYLYCLRCLKIQMGIYSAIMVHLISMQPENDFALNCYQGFHTCVLRVWLTYYIHLLKMTGL